MHRHDVDRFGEWAPTYEQHWMQRRIMGPVQDTVLEVAAAQVLQPEAILDIGCGTGRLLRAAAERFPGARLEGVDAAEGMVKQAAALLPAGTQIHFQLATAESLPFEDSSFELVFSTMTFHHWSDQEKAIGEVKRVLTPRGRWILADIVAKGPMAFALKLLRIGRVVSPSGLDQMVDAKALAVIDRKKVGGTGGNISVLAIGSSTRDAHL